MPSGTFVIALDQRGKHLGSEKLAALMNEHMVQSVPEWTFLIGGPYGLSETLRKEADLVLSLSAMTLTHQMARLLILEQLYRCCTIIRNEPYHH
jgi:23S rRNA (pseudouridine1915-N3)-methyltransferase